MGLPTMPNGNLVYKRGEIWWVNLDPAVGSETGKRRPCLILKNDLGNQYSETTIVAPLTRSRKRFPFLVNVAPTAQNGLDEVRAINLSQLRVVAFQRVFNRLGVMEDRYWKDIEKAVSQELGFGDPLTD
jgi:mRNA interferase MazF